MTSIWLQNLNENFKKILVFMQGFCHVPYGLQLQHPEQWIPRPSSGH